MPEERRIHCPNCGSQLWKLPKGADPNSLFELECAKCGKSSRHWEIVSAMHHESTQYEEEHGIGDIPQIHAEYAANKQVSSMVEDMRLRKQRLRVLERLIEIQHLTPLTQDERNRVLAGAPVDFVKAQVWKRRLPSGPSFYDSSTTKRSA